MMADIKFAFVACAFLSCLLLNGCAQQYEVETVKSQVNNWQTSRSRLRGRAATQSVATSPHETLDNASPDITTRNRQRIRGRYFSEPVGEELYRYKVPQDPTVERSPNFRSRTNIKTLEDSLNTERYQKRLETPQRRNGFVDTTDVPFSRNQNDVGTSTKRLDRMRSRIAVERGGGDAISRDSRAQSRGRTIYHDSTIEDVAAEAKFSRTRGFTSRYQNVESTEPTQRKNVVQTEQVKQELVTSAAVGKVFQTNQPQQADSAAPLLPQIYESIPGVKPQQQDTVFPNLSTQKFSTDPAQQFSRRSDTILPADAVSSLQLDSRDAERTTQFIPIQTQKGRNRGRTTYQTAEEATPDTIIQAKTRTRQNSFRSRTRVLETTTPSSTPPIRSRTNSPTRNTPRALRGRSRVEAEQQASDRVFTDNAQYEPPKSENLPPSTAKETKSADEIDETDNYPKEFLEKLKKSKAYTSSSKVTYRSKRRQYPTTTISTTKSDSETSETNTKETHEESTGQTDRYSQRFYKKLSQKSEEPKHESTSSEGTKPPTEERRKFVPKKKLTAEERKERISRLKEKLRKNATEDELKAEESKESFVKESLVTQANTHPGSREVFPTEEVKSTVEVKSSVSSNIKRVKKPRGKVKFRDESKDLIPLGSEEQIVVVKNETTTKKSGATKKSTTTKKPPSTTRLPRTVTTTARPVATTQAVISTTKGDFAVLVSRQKAGVVDDTHGHAVPMFQNVTLFPSTRHRFSARINSSATFSLPPDVELVTTTTPLTALTTPEGFPLFERKPEFTLSVNKLFNTSVTSTNSSTSITTSTTLKPSTTSPKTTTRTTTRRSNSKKKSSGKKKTKKSKTSRTTTKKPKSSTISTTTVRPASNSTGVRPLTLAFSDIQTIINETVKIVNSNSMTGPSSGVVPRSELNALTPETILNGTTEATMGTGDSPTTIARANTNSSVNSTNKIELPARLTEVECSNGTCTKSKSQSVYFNEDNSNSEPIPYARQKGTTKSPENLRKIFIYGVFPNNTVQRKPFPGDGDRSPARFYSRLTTSLPPYTSGDYDVFGVYPNNSVVRRRGWKTFDYEKYHSPYVIFGIYPNNTIIKKFPNGTTINDRFMVSDNEIYKSDGKIYCTCADPAHRGVTPHVFPVNTTTTSTTTTTTTTTTDSTTTTQGREEEEEEGAGEGDAEEEEKEEEEESEEEEEENEENEKPDRNPKEEVENVDVELGNVSETEESTEQSTEISTDAPSAEVAKTTHRTLEEAEEADLVSTTTEPNRLENAEEADNASTPRDFEDSTSNSLERQETQNKGTEDAEEADSKESDSLSNAENADVRTTERSENTEENLEERTEKNERLEEVTTENASASLRDVEGTKSDDDTADESESTNARTTESSVDEVEGTEKSEDLEERRIDVTPERSENMEEETTDGYYEESTTESKNTLEERTGNYLTEPKTEKSESLKELPEDGTERSEGLKDRFDENEITTTERSENFEDVSMFGTTQRSMRLEQQTEGYSYELQTTEEQGSDFGTSEGKEKYEELIGGQFYEPRENELSEQTGGTENSESLKEQTDERTTERSEKLYARTDEYELTTERRERPEERGTERSENIEEQTTPARYEDSTKKRNENVEEQISAEEQLEERYEEPKNTERTVESFTTERSERLQSQETPTEQAFLGDLLRTESPETIQATQTPLSSTERETAQTDTNIDLTDRTTTQATRENIAAEDIRETGFLQNLSATSQRPEENTIPVKVIYEENYKTATETTPQRIGEMASEDLHEIGILKGLSATTQRPDENTIPVKVIYDGYDYEKPTGKPFTYEDVFAKGSDLVGSTNTVITSAVEGGTETATESAITDYEIDVRELGNLISRLTTSMFGETTPPTDTAEAVTSRKETTDLLEALLPLSVEYIQASTSGNAVKKRHRKSVDDLDEPSSLTNLAYRSLSSSETTSTPISILTTTTKLSLSTSATRFKPKKLKNYSKTSVTAYKHLTNLTSTPRPDDVFIVTPVGSVKENPDADYLKRGKVKFVTLTPGVVVTTNIHDENDILTMSSQHVQKVTKAPAKIPDNFLSTVFGELEEKASSPIPDILKNVENDLQGDGLSVSLARRIITLALEKAMTSTTPVAPVTSPSSTTTTISPSTTTLTSNQQLTLAPTRVTTFEPTSTTRKPITTKKPTTTRSPLTTTTVKPTTKKPVTSTTRRPRTTSTTTTTTTTSTTSTTSTTEQTREILITPKKTQGQVSRRPAPVITSPEFLQSTIGPEIGDGRTAVEVPVALEPLNVLFASDKLSSTTTATPTSPKPTEDLNVILSGLFPEPTPSSSKAPEHSNLVTHRPKSTKDKSSLSKQASASLSESDLKILEAILQQQGTNGGGQDLEQIVQNQIRLAEEVRKASRNLRKKPRTTTTTTTERPTPLGLGFLLNLFGSGSRPNGPGLFANEAKNFRRQRPTTPSTFITLTNTSQASPDPFNELDSEGTATGERSVRGELVSAAIDVTKAVSKFMGTVLSSAAQSFQNFFRNLGR